MSTSEFFWGVHLLLIGVYIYEIVFYFIDKKKYPDAFEAVNKAKKFDPNFELATEKEIGGLALWGGVHCAVFGTIQQEWPIGLIILIGFSFYFGMHRERAKPLITAARLSEHQNEQRKDKTSSERKFNDDGFDYEESSFSSRSKPPPPRHDAPRGQENWHPDDKNLWAKVYDPAATDAEQQEAFRAIQRRQRRREGKDSRDLKK